MSVHADSADHPRQRQRGVTTSERAVRAVLAGTADRRGAVAEDQEAVGPDQLHAVPVQGQQEAGAGAHLDEEHGLVRSVCARQCEGGGEIDTAVHLVGLRGSRSDHGAELVLVGEDGSPDVRPWVADGQVVATHDARVPARRWNIRSPQHEIVDGRQPEDRAVLAGGRLLEQGGAVRIGGDAAAYRAVDGQFRVARGELGEAALQRRQVGSSGAHRANGNGGRSTGRRRRR